MSNVSDRTDDLFRLFVEEATAYAIIFISLDGRIRQWNIGAERLFGYTADEVCGLGAELIFLPEDRENGVPERELRTAREKGEAEDRRWKIRKDGSRFFADGILFALSDGGDICGFGKIIRDATASRQAEDLVVESESRLRLIVDSIHDYAIYLLDPAGTIRTWSRGAQRIKGYSDEEVIGRNFDLFYPEEDGRGGKPRRQLEIAAERGTYEDESTHVRKDGSRFWASVVVSAIRDGEGKLLGFVNLTHDITQQKRTQERSEFLAEVSRVLSTSIEYDQTLRQIAKLVVNRISDWCAIDLVSDEGASVSRVVVEHADPEKIAYAKKLQEKYPPDPNDQGLRQVIQERKTLFYPDISDQLLRQTARDDEHLRIVRELGLRSAIVTPLIAAGRLLGTLTLVTSGDRTLTEDDLTLSKDIAVRAATAVQNAQLYREAQEANRAKDDFLATVSHELRTPMTAILGWSKLLRLESDPAVIAEAALAIERSARAQSQLIDDILDVARIRVGKLRIRKAETNFADVVRNAVETVRVAADAKNIALRVQIGRSVVPVLGDSQRLEQVVWNILSNAVKFTPSRGRVDVVLSETETHARLTIEDTGPGIPAEFIPHLFQRFRQAESEQDRGHGGLGLGLSIAHYIVDAHGGTIIASSAEESGGARFVVELPLLEEQTVPQEGRRATDDWPRLPEANIVVVEDDPDTLQFLCRALERAGATVRAASSVDEALALLKEKLPDVVVSDVAMPGRTGYDLVHELRRDESHVPALAVTASGTIGDRDRAMSAGFDDYLRKPVEPTLLIRRIAALLNRQ